MADDTSLLDLLEARSGVVCAVGAGGKKSVLRRLALMNPGRVAITATVFTTYFQEQIGFEVAIEEDADLMAAVGRLDPSRNVAYACPGDKPARRGGARPDTIERIHRAHGFVASYVKADGARMRLIKAPADDEPVLPRGATTVIPVVSARALGEPLSERVAHRIEQLTHVTGLQPNETIRPVHLGRLLSSDEGLLKQTEGRRVVPIINMVDDADREAGAREAARVALDACARLERVVLTCLTRDSNPVVAVVSR